ncbi:MAG: cytochrome c peroxidase [Myxococcota bacterium]
MSPALHRSCRAPLARVGLVLAVLATGCGEEPVDSIYDSVEQLGEALFSDANLSADRTQSCSTCHDPERAFTDGRPDPDGMIAAVSLGDDGVSWGDRNAPTVAYASFAPEFHFGRRPRPIRHNNHRLYEGALGGQFWDGRETDLEGQAGGPPLNALEMGMPDEAAVVERLREDIEYERGFIEFFGADVFATDEEAYAAMTESLAAFERTEVFAPFDSRYDRSLRGEIALTFKELTGESVFFSQFANCSVCHALHRDGDPINRTAETFTGYEFHNIGVPVNEQVRERNGVAGPDLGLVNNPAATDAERGKFKVPTLRNVAVTGPYMHNGVFRDLVTVVEFYDRFNNADERLVNPETGEPWREPEVPDTVTDLLEVGDPLTDLEVESLVCFLRALTDARYEHLIEPKGIDCSL